MNAQEIWQKQQFGANRWHGYFAAGWHSCVRVHGMAALPMSDFLQT